MKTETVNGEGTKVLFAIEGNLGYAADQVSGMTLAELLNAVEAAVDEFGADAEVVVHQTNNRYGANFGRIDPYADMFTPAEPECDCDNGGEFHDEVCPLAS